VNVTHHPHQQKIGDLQDKFCDSVDLKDSWENMQIPDELVTFCVRY